MSAAFLLRAVRTCLERTVVCLLWLVVFPAAAADWPQFRGANHDGISTEHIKTDWSGSVTTPVWLVPVTNSLCCFAVSGARAVTQIRRRIDGVDRDVCVALSTSDGSELWATTIEDSDYPSGGVGYDDGPRTTPAVDGGSVYILSSYLNLFRINVTNGNVIWQKNLRTIYVAAVIGYQNCASPVMENGLIYLNANCPGGSLMALHSSDGELEWRSQDEGLTHSTPVLATIHGVRQVIFATQSGLTSLNPLTGGLLWHFNYPFSCCSSSLAVSPVVYDDMVWICGAHDYGMAATVMRANLTNNVWTTTQLWTANTVTAHWMTPVAHDGFLYGQFGIQQYDGQNAQLKCIDMATGNEKWSVEGFGRGGTLVVDNHLLVITEVGELVLAEAKTNVYVELGRFLAIPDYNGDVNKCWNFHAVSEGQVYVRSTSYGARFNLSSLPPLPPSPPVKLDYPELESAKKFRLTIRTTDGTPLDSNRLATMELRATTNLSLPVVQWNKLTNQLVFTNGIVSVTNVDGGTLPRQFFIIREPY